MPLSLDDFVVQVPEKPAWYKRTSFLIVVAMGVIVLASVLVDLPSKVTPASDAAAQTTLLHEINNDVAGCAYAITESFTIYRDFQANTLSAQNRTQVPSMLRDDQAACSLTSSTIYDLANIQPTGSTAGQKVGDIAQLALLWSTTHAQAAIVDIQEIFDGNRDPAKRLSLENDTKALTQERIAALSDLKSAEAQVHAILPRPNLPRVSL